MADKKRQKTSHFYQKNKNKLYLEAGLRGFFCTCNFREKDCVKEAYNLLNEVADKLYGHSQQNPNETSKNEHKSDENETEDISDQLTKELDELKQEKKKNVKERRFQAVDTGASNCVFIRTNLSNPEAIAKEIFEEILNTKKQKARYLLRLVPIMITCKANMSDIVQQAGELFDKYFLKEPSTFSIVFNKRYHNSISRTDCIKELAELITAKNINNKADLKNPQLAVIIEIIKGICLISIVPKYFEYRKYNLFELAKKDTQDDKETESDAEKELVTTDTQESKETEMNTKKDEKSTNNSEIEEAVNDDILCNAADEIEQCLDPGKLST